MFHTILIANRGEIACRIAATAKRLGIQTVAVYSEADANAKHVAVCDQAILIGPPAAQDSYLHIPKIIAAAKASGAQAIHPGYGFLSENSEFAQACDAAGLIFIGPPASAISLMGSKSAAKTLMQQTNVPLVPGYHGEQQDADSLQQQANIIGYPILLKPSAGGGGKGMRIVESAVDFHTALAACKREAKNAFGDDKVLLEKYLRSARHIEIQIFADSHGNCISLFERDCSLQRRHQKIMEEAPAPGMTPARRKLMGQAAVNAAQAVGYVGAGTVEFIVPQHTNDKHDGAFYFMEMNTRLQVEHPVTEMITGLDLVEWQLRIALGEKLPKTQDELTLSGHAMEARIYAENPEKGFLPSIGTLHHLHTPSAASFTTQEATRIDSGVRQGDAITPFYDPMIAKLIVWGENRDVAQTRMAQALADYQIVGLDTNIPFLQRLITHPDFIDAKLDTAWIERQQASLFPPLQPLSPATLALAVVALISTEANNQDENDPWSRATGWRMNQVLQRALYFTEINSDKETSSTHTVMLHYPHNQTAHHWRLEVQGKTMDCRLIARNDSNFHITLDDITIHGTAPYHAGAFHVFHEGKHTALTYSSSLMALNENKDEQNKSPEGGRLTAPMPGKILAILVKKGQQVKQGTPLLIMEAMKMEHTITAPHDGAVQEIHYAVGDQVTDGTLLLGVRRG